MTKKHILIVEDDRPLARVLEYNLNNAGYETQCSSDGQDALNQVRLKIPKLIVLDLMIPVIDGLEVCRQLKASNETRDIIILMLTAKGAEADQLAGFSVGADDYVVKPFSVKILLERIKALLRRNSLTNNQGSEVTICGNIVLDRIALRVSVDDIDVALTPSEYRLLDTLIRHPGRAFDRNELIVAALGADALALERTIDVHVQSLRKKLGEEKRWIQTVRGIGYRFLEDA